MLGQLFYAVHLIDDILLRHLVVIVNGLGAKYFSQQNIKQEIILIEKFIGKSVKMYWFKR